MFFTFNTVLCVFVYLRICVRGKEITALFMRQIEIYKYTNRILVNL